MASEKPLYQEHCGIHEAVEESVFSFTNGDLLHYSSKVSGLHVAYVFIKHYSMY